MGDRWNIRNDEELARRYREETPGLARLRDKALMTAFVIGMPLLIFYLMTRSD